ncbi:hypothetical protein M378DRAFT_162633 [Amanita muscaria Koide BX008]|uniref:Uncharacterized protein n=1 Tax=Amanita muscaria (strain Koide BX008) TaxID=946122 RepID=A0A0C2SPB6_AMAMK|nr:hypothetical protein M378DRAFT_162633 [Amanita muscaria Koide BX008]
MTSISPKCSHFPTISTSIFQANGSIYNQKVIFGTNFQLNQTALVIDSSFCWPFSTLLYAKMGNGFR